MILYKLYDDVMIDELQSRLEGLRYEFLPPGGGKTIAIKTPAMACNKYIDGSYAVRVTLSIIYRCLPNDDTKRKAAEAAVNELIESLIGGGCTLHIDGKTIIVRTADLTGASMLTRYDNGAEDHAADITLTYEVI